MMAESAENVSLVENLVRKLKIVLQTIGMSLVSYLLLVLRHGNCPSFLIIKEHIIG